jgi:hypothetical protein
MDLLVTLIRERNLTPRVFTPLIKTNILSVCRLASEMSYHCKYQGDDFVGHRVKQIDAHNAIARTIVEPDTVTLIACWAMPRCRYGSPLVLLPKAVSIFSCLARSMLRLQLSGVLLVLNPHFYERLDLQRRGKMTPHSF